MRLELVSNLVVCPYVKRYDRMMVVDVKIQLFPFKGRQPQRAAAA